MNRESVQSSMIASLGYESNTSTLEVEFNSGAVWQYFDVPESIYYDMQRVPEAQLARTWGARTLAIAFEHERSTTALLRRLRQ